MVFGKYQSVFSPHVALFILLTAPEEHTFTISSVFTLPPPMVPSIARAALTYP
jgi:hypothetical protein